MLDENYIAGVLQAYVDAVSGDDALRVFYRMAVDSVEKMVLEGMALT